MDNTEILGHLLEIEKEAAALVNDAQAEADRRIAEYEKKARSVYDESYRHNAQKLELEFQNNKERVKEQYKIEIENYRNELFGLKKNMDGFSALFNKILSGEG